MIVAMVSSNLARAGHPSRVTILLEDPLALPTGLKSDSVVMTDNLATIAATCQTGHRADAANGSCR
jgi:mRNA interferase MazF